MEQNIRPLEYGEVHGNKFLNFSKRVNLKLFTVLMSVPLFSEFVKYVFHDKESFNLIKDAFELSVSLGFSFFIYLYARLYIKKSDIEKEKYKYLFDNLQTGVFIRDEFGNIVESNIEYNGIIGYSSGTTPWDLFESKGVKIIDQNGTPFDKGQLPSDLALKEGKIFVDKIVGLQSLDGKIRWISLSAYPMNIKGCGVVVSFNDVTQKIETEKELLVIQQKLKDSLFFIEQFVNSLPVAAFYKDLNGIYRFFNDVTCKYCGLKEDTVIGKTAFDVYPESLAQLFVEKDKELLDDGIPLVNYEYETIDSEGKIKFLMEMKSLIYGQDKKPIGIVGVTIDISDRKILEQDVIIQKKILESLLFNYPDTLYMVDRDLNVILGKDKTVLQKVLKEDSFVKIGEVCEKSLLGGFGLCKELGINLCFEKGEITVEQYYNELDQKFYKITIFPVFGLNNNIEFVGIVLKDITLEKIQEDKIKLLAQRDPLTGLYNRTHFINLCMQRVDGKLNRKKDNFAIIFIDLDKFKPINDKFGHATGDLVLKEVSKRLVESCRGNDIVCRLGGDEFIIGIFDILTKDDVLAVVEKIHHMLMSPIKIFFEDNYYEVCVLASIGISMSGDFVGEEILIDNMIDSADKAMYKVKGDEKNYYSF